MDRDQIDGDFASLAEPPISAEAVRRNVARCPQAAQVCANLLRSVSLENNERGLIQESLAYGLLQGSAEHLAWLARQSHALAPAGAVSVYRDNDVLGIRLDRPSAANAIDRVMRDALHEAFTVAAIDDDIVRVVLTAAGKAFSMGGDLSEFGTTRDPATAHAIRMEVSPALPISRVAHKLHAHVQGACIGAGLEMAAFALRLTATPNAWFQLPELAMGLIPGAGGCVSVPRRIGRRRAALLVLSGRRISAATALAWGLIDAIVDEASVDDGGTHVIG